LTISLFLSIFLYTIFKKMSHNVLAVYDVGAGIKGLCAAKTARPNVGEGAVGAQRPRRLNPKPPKAAQRKQSCYAQ
jgi:hypothetical protein